MDSAVAWHRHGGARSCRRPPGWFQTTRRRHVHIPRQKGAGGAVFQGPKGLARLVPILDLRRQSSACFSSESRRGDDLAGYAAGFRFSPDSQWLVRMQKLGAGYQTLFLYRRNGYRFSPATNKPLGDLVWDYFFSMPESKGMRRDPKDPYALNHAFAGLVKGMEENYAWMGQHWPGSRYIVISLSFDQQGEENKTPWIEDWRCVYDMKTAAFSVPPDFAENNAKAVKYPQPQ